MVIRADKEFQEIAHCGGQITIDLRVVEGNVQVAFGVRHSSPRPASFFMIFSDFFGKPLATIGMGGLADEPANVPQAQGFQIFIASDTQGMFGHQCPRCGHYWRSSGCPASWPMTCPYCAVRTGTHNFRTLSQRKYIADVCSRTREVVENQVVGETIIDMDRIADAVTQVEKPPFYYAEQQQQNLYKCSSCNANEDILGRYGYCSICGIHNGFQELQRDLAAARKRIADGAYVDALSDIVSGFDSYGRQLARNMAGRIPMRKKRKEMLNRQLFHSLQQRADELSSWFDIHLFDKIPAEDISFARQMFLRRHLYEHNGGEVDQRYLEESGDQSVRVKQSIRESSESVTRLAEVIEKIAKNFKIGFDEIFPGEQSPIDYEQERQNRMRKTR